MLPHNVVAAWSSDEDGDEIATKGGVETGLLNNSTTSVSFVTAFASTPNVCATFGATSNTDDRMTIVVGSITTTGFDIILRGNPTIDVQWIATDEGNP